MRCAVCKFVLNSVPDYDNHLLSEQHLSKLKAQAHRPKRKCETCNKDFLEKVNENPSRSQTHINNRIRDKLEWKSCGTCNIELRRTFCDKHIRSKKDIVNQGSLRVREEVNILQPPLLKELAFQNIREQ